MRKFLLGSAKLIATSAFLAIFVCYCKIFDNLVKKVEKPWLLDKNWMMVLSISLLAYSFFKIVSSVLKPRTEVVNGKTKDNGSIFRRIIGGLIGTALLSVPGVLMLNHLINPESVNVTIHPANSVKTIFIVESIGVVAALITMVVLLVCVVINLCTLCCCMKFKDKGLEEECSQRRPSCSNSLRVNQSPNNQDVDDSQLPSYDQVEQNDQNDSPPSYDFVINFGKGALNFLI